MGKELLNKSPIIKKLEQLLNSYRNKRITKEKLLEFITTFPYEEISQNFLDIHRQLRKGIPEVIYCEKKSEKHLVEIINKLYSKHSFVIGTRLDKSVFSKIKSYLPKSSFYFEEARLLFVGKKKKPSKGFILVISAGNTDIPVAEEAAVFCELMGNKVQRVYDVGAAGLHRLKSVLPFIYKARVIIVVAGMDGVLPTIVAGISKVPVIAVPTSIGYGASFNGLSALLTMLNSCSNGVVVVNIDNGFGAGYVANMINKR